MTLPNWSTRRWLYDVVNLPFFPKHTHAPLVFPPPRVSLTRDDMIAARHWRSDCITKDDGAYDGLKTNIESLIKHGSSCKTFLVIKRFDGTHDFVGYQCSSEEKLRLGGLVGKHTPRLELLELLLRSDASDPPPPCHAGNFITLSLPICVESLQRCRYAPNLGESALGTCFAVLIGTIAPNFCSKL